MLERAEVYLGCYKGFSPLEKLGLFGLCLNLPVLSYPRNQELLLSFVTSLANLF